MDQEVGLGGDRVDPSADHATRGGTGRHPVGTDQGVGEARDTSARDRSLSRGEVPDGIVGDTVEGTAGESDEGSAIDGDVVLGVRRER